MHLHSLSSRSATTKRTSLASILAVGVAALTGCASSATHSQPPAQAPAGVSRTSTADNARTDTPVNSGVSAHAQYAAFANAVNLRTQDLPGFTPSANRHEGKHAESEPELERCVDEKETKPLLKAKSDKFRSGSALDTASANSSVQIMPSIAVVRMELAKIRGALGDPADRSCLIRLVDTSFARQDRVIHVGSGTVHVAFSDTKLAPVQLGTVAGTDGAFGLSLSMKVTYTVVVRGQNISVTPVPLSIDALGFARGRAEVTLDTMAFGKEFSPELESKLFSLLVSRATGAVHQYPAIQR